MKLTAAVLIATTCLSACDNNTDAGRATNALEASANDRILEADQNAANKLMDTLKTYKEIQPGHSKQFCLGESGHQINQSYVLCRNGWVEEAQYDIYGRRRVLHSYPMPNYGMNTITAQGFMQPSMPLPSADSKRTGRTSSDR